jgi:hypothetical protein
MNNWCICWFFTHILLGILIFKGLTARRLYKSFGVKGLKTVFVTDTACLLRGTSWVLNWIKLGFVLQFADISARSSCVLHWAVKYVKLYFSRGVHEICALLGYYAVYSGSSLPTFRDNIRCHLHGPRSLGFIYHWRYPKRRYGIVTIRYLTLRCQSDCLFQANGKNVPVVYSKFGGTLISPNYGQAIAEKFFTTSFNRLKPSGFFTYRQV